MAKQVLFKEFAQLVFPTDQDSDSYIYILTSLVICIFLIAPYLTVVLYAIYIYHQGVIMYLQVLISGSSLYLYYVLCWFSFCKIIYSQCVF